MATMYKPTLQLKKNEGETGGECLYEKRKESRTSVANGYNGFGGMGIGGNTLIEDLRQSVDEEGVDRLSKEDILQMLEEV